MSLAQKSSGWRPSASINTLKQRAGILSALRHFFEKRGVLEVETPQLSHAVGTDPFLHYFSTDFSLPNIPSTHMLYLQTSPEFAMKRLLAAHSGPIFQICKAYRNGEVGHLHNPEFTLLEWYQPGFDHHALIQDVDLLLQSVLHSQPGHSISYQALFETHFHFNPHTATLEEIRKKALSRAHSWENSLIDRFDKDTWLQYLLATFIEPTLGQESPCYVYDFPQSQAALARLRREDTFFVAERFEVYVKGIELGNGFHELCDPDEQKQRFLNDLQIRETQRCPLPPLDQHFLAALSSLPPCAGIAMGIDRLIMLATQASSIKEVLSFPFENS
ncbi:MAG: elongation factor P--(R)-beta-lysine ligase [Gammaproteobacteria bacterium]|nr:elongation factor P--(R)-beta-lysine ligase [Gammaproteobacteria bacterium]